MTVNGKEEKAQRVYRLEDRGHDPSNFAAAMERAMEWGDQIPIGLFYRKTNPRPSLDALDSALQAGGAGKQASRGEQGAAQGSHRRVYVIR